MTNQKAFEKRKQIIVEVVIEGREKYDNDEGDNIDNGVENEYREGFETK